MVGYAAAIIQYWMVRCVELPVAWFAGKHDHKLYCTAGVAVKRSLRYTSPVANSRCGEVMPTAYRGRNWFSVMLAIMSHPGKTSSTWTSGYQ